jgi:drug/metabolite transporter (DMT)-like permease
MTTITFAALYWAEQYISSGLAALLSATGPLMIILMSFLLEKKLITRMQWIGLLVGFIGVYLIVLPKLHEELSTSWLFGALSIVGAEFFYALGAIRSRRMLSGDVSPWMLNGFQMLFGSIGLLVASFLFETSPLHVADKETGTIALLYLIFFGSIVASGIYYWLVKVTNPLFPSTWLYVSPVIALIVGYLFLQETVHPLGIVGSIAILGGVFLTNYEAFRGTSFVNRNTSSSTSRNDIDTDTV